MENKKILLVYRGRFASCPRPKRLYLQLRKKNIIDICSLDTNSLDGVTSFPIIKKTPSPLRRLIKKIIMRLKIGSLAEYVASANCELSIEKERVQRYD